SDSHAGPRPGPGGGRPCDPACPAARHSGGGAPLRPVGGAAGERPLLRGVLVLGWRRLIGAADHRIPVHRRAPPPPLSPLRLPAPLFLPGLPRPLGLRLLLLPPLLPAIGPSPHAPLRASVWRCQGPPSDPEGPVYGARSEDRTDDPGRELLLPDPLSL